MKKFLLVLLVLSFILLPLSKPVYSKELAPITKGEIHFYSGLILVTYSFLFPVRWETTETVVDLCTGKKKEETYHYAHPRWIELAIGIILHQIGSNLILINNGLAYQIEF